MVHLGVKGLVSSFRVGFDQLYPKDFHGKVNSLI